jgi:DNA invertase Pin-like site-specific DNA recombinase
MRTIKKAIDYVRVSTEQQAKEGVSIEAQQAKIKAW